MGTLRTPEAHEPERPLVEAALQRIVQSQEFRTSQRSVDFLTYVVGKWLSQDLRMRSIF